MTMVSMVLRMPMAVIAFSSDVSPSPSNSCANVCAYNTQDGHL